MIQRFIKQFIDNDNYLEMIDDRDIKIAKLNKEIEHLKSSRPLVHHAKIIYWLALNYPEINNELGKVIAKGQLPKLNDEE